MRRSPVAAALTATLLVTSTGPPAHAAPTIVRIAGPGATFRSASADGNMVIVHDGTQELLIDRRTDGPPVPLPFRGGILTPDGTKILHSGPAPSPVAEVAAEPPPDVLRYDIATGADTVLTGGLSDDWAYAPTSSNWDGTIVGIQAKSAPLDDARVLVLDTATGVATYPDATLPRGRSYGLTMSHKGHMAAFSWVGTASRRFGLFVWEAGSGATVLVPESPLDLATSRPHHGASISGDGTHVVFIADAPDLAPAVADDPNAEPASTPGADRVLLYDIRDERTTAIARTYLGAATGVDDSPSVNHDGTRVAFLRAAPTSPDGRGPQLFVHDVEVGTTRQITQGAGGTTPNGPVTSSRLVADGRTVYWDSTATNYLRDPSPAALAPTVAGSFVYAAGLPASAACTITGTNGPDTLVGTSGDDIICGLAGNDTIRGLSGDDVILGGAGNDKIAGGPGDDRIHAGEGNDSAEGGNGDDAIRGGGGRDSIVGGNGADTLAGGDGNDRLSGGTGHDVVFAGAGNDTAAGGNGNDELHGGSGADVLEGGNGGDDLFGDDGRDRLYGGPGPDDLDGGAHTDLCRLGSGGATQVNCEL